MNTPLIETRHLKKYFETSSGLLHAVDDVNLTIGRGQTLGVVGESGCGKSTFGRDGSSFVPQKSRQLYPH